MTGLRRHEYSRNPLDILIDRENATCKGCTHRLIVWGKEACNKNRRPKRCKFYKEEEGKRHE